jgi:hypothetical protein
MRWEFLRTAGSLTELIVVLAGTALPSGGGDEGHRVETPYPNQIRVPQLAHSRVP